jgi:putative SOS response-associated peptidase YedK
MCGRFTLSTPAEQVAATFAVADPPPLTPRYNVAPSQVIAVVGLKADGTRRGLALLRWGLVPSWATDPNAGPRPINARAETILSKPTFREPFRRRRCLIPADGFYEWRKSGTRKTPCHIRLKGGGLLAFAGLWDTWSGPDEARLATCCIITVAANELVRPIHDRMPVILPPDDYDRWLSPSTPEAELVGLLRPYPADEMVVVPVGPAVNSVTNDGPECLTPAA